MLLPAGGLEVRAWSSGSGYEHSSRRGQVFRCPFGTDHIRAAEPTGMWFMISARIRIARSLMEVGLYEQAESLLGPGYDVMAAQLGEQHSDTRLVRRLLFALYTALGRPGDARAHSPVPSQGEEPCP